MKRKLLTLNAKDKIHPWQEQASLESIKFSRGKPVWTMVMPVFNQESRIKEVLSKVVANASLPFSMVLIDDASDDRSYARSLSFIQKLKKIKQKKVIDIFLIKNKMPLYETACDNQGFRLAKTKYIIEIQSDIHIEDFGFDRKMIDGMDKLNLGAVSGRHVHYFSMLEGKMAWLKYPFNLLSWRFFHSTKEGEGQLGHKIFSRIKGQIKKECFVGETVARGPWLINKFDLKKLSYLDEKNFFLGNDDHDYHRRLFQELGKSVGYIPLDIYSLIEDGSTRKGRQGTNKLIYEYLFKNKKGSKDFRHFLRFYRPFKPIKKFKL
ncbi:glycosyltransferase family 2 protein [Candidatus Methylopumilus planktonicus]|uniref:glycosyltransferase n=1 Tax=Candidatus Methylopumilus planktonicus TaxID=1581557 RepID=UPI001120D484|nr:glycosyltransferase [Candidatus Methylopumilus planktonicus]QDD01803.1 glycosyltransferase family 2 protein [Candidatus Methylopumilus planktonicus]